MRVFAGQRDEGFYVDLGIFDLLGVGSGQVEDSTAGFNVSTLAIQVPMSRADAQRLDGRAAPNDPNAIIGVWSTASRPAMRDARAGRRSPTAATTSRCRASASRSSTKR